MNKIIRDITILFERVKEDYCEQIRIRNAFSQNNYEYRVAAIEIKRYQLKNILIRLDNI